VLNPKLFSNLHATSHIQRRCGAFEKNDMKIKLTILFLAFSSILFSQELKIIQAVQGKDSNFFEYEDYETPDRPIGELIFLKGCSWYCGGSVKSIKASSELKENNGINYSPKNAHDFDKTQLGLREKLILESENLSNILLTLVK